MGNINQRLNGLNPLSYMGVNASQPPQVVIYLREPTTNDINFELGTFWIIPDQTDTPNLELFVLLDLKRGEATWAKVYPGSGGGGGVNSVIAGNSISITGTATDPVVNVAGLTNHAVQIGNLNNTLMSLPVGTTGQVLTGVTSADPVWAAPASSSITISGDAGSPISGNSFIFSGGTSGAVFTGDGASTMTESFDYLSLPLTTDTDGQILINSSPVFHTYGNTPADNNTFVGKGAGNFTLTSLSTNNTATGANSLLSVTDGTQNSAFGVSSLSSLADGSFNVGCGYSALAGITSGNNNTAIGYNAGQALTTTDSGNTLIGASEGVSGDTNTIRIGTQTAQLCFIGGIDSVNVGNTVKVATMGTANQLGTANIVAGTGIAVTPSANQILIDATSVPGFLAYIGVSTDYVVQPDDEYISVTLSGSPITIELPNAPTTGRIFTIKDKAGTSAANNITITTVGGTVLIDGATTFVMNTAFQATSVIFGTSAYEVY